MMHDIYGPDIIQIMALWPFNSLIQLSDRLTQQQEREFNKEMS